MISTYGASSIGWLTQAVGGNWPWSNLVRYPANLQTANVDLVLCDIRPTDTARQLYAAEAMIRRIWTDRPNARILSVIFPHKNELSDTTVAPQDATDIAGDALTAHYGIPNIDYRQAVIDAVAGGDPLTKYIAADQLIHPTMDEGHTLAASLVEAYLAAHPSFTFGTADHSTLPALYNAAAGYYSTTEPQRILGTANDGTTGTWTTTGTRIESSEAGATATFIVTCHSFGLYSAGTANSVCDVQIDGGAWQENVAVTHNGNYTDDLADGEHTIIIRVRSGAAIRIDEFWAI